MLRKSIFYVRKLLCVNGMREETQKHYMKMGLRLLFPNLWGLPRQKREMQLRT